MLVPQRRRIQLTSTSSPTAHLECNTLFPRRAERRRNPQSPLKGISAKPGTMGPSIQACLLNRPKRYNGLRQKIRAAVKGSPLLPIQRWQNIIQPSYTATAMWSRTLPGRLQKNTSLFARRSWTDLTRFTASSNHTIATVCRPHRTDPISSRRGDMLPLARQLRSRLRMI